MKNINKLFLSAIICLFLLSCATNFDEQESIRNVKKIFPNSKVYKKPSVRFTYYVVDSTGIKIVKTTNLLDNYVSSVVQCDLIK